MDVAHPIRAVVPTLDGPVLAVLERTTRPLSGREVHRLAGVGSANGVRRVLARLAQHGLVRAEEHGNMVLYEANREHVAWPAVEILTRLRHSFLGRLRESLRSWQPQPVHASLFGSVARGEGDTESDIDVLLVRPSGFGEDDSPWAANVDRLRVEVQAWTGNDCQIFQVGEERLADYVRVGDPLIDAWRRDAIRIAGQDLHRVLAAFPSAGQR